MDKIPYNGNLGWLKERTILFVRHGSHAYGTNLPESDQDYKGVCIPPQEYFYGCMNQFYQAESHKPDMVIYDIRKFIKLAADCNPSIIEVLWVDNVDVLICDKLGNRLRASRDAFLSKKAKHTFSGYAVSQLKRIQLHRRYLLDPPKAPPTRAEFGLREQPEINTAQLQAAQAAVSKKLDEWQPSFVDDLDEADKLIVKQCMTDILAEISVFSSEKYTAAARAIGFDDNLIRILNLEGQYKSKLHEWHSYLTWKRERNPARAELEAKYGYDTKHAMHLVRLMRMCKEILEGKGVIVKRPDRDELLAIRRGEWVYDDLLQWAHDQDEALWVSYQSSQLPHHPDRQAIDKLCVEIVRDMF